MTCPKTCATAPNIRITQELLDKDSLSYGEANEYRERLGSVRITKGKHVALIFAKRADESRPTPYLKCACDFHFEEREHARMHYIDTYKCSRKEAWYKKRTKEVAAEYNDKGLSPREIILDIFDRAVCKGEFLGQRNGDWIYVQHIGEIFAMLVWGVEECPFKRNSAFVREENRKREESHAQIRKLPGCSEWISSQKHLSIKDLSVSYVLWHIRELYREKKLGLNGMVLIPYHEPPPEIPDETRTMLLPWGYKEGDDWPPLLVWVVRPQGRYQAEVQRISRSRATLCLFDHQDNDKLLKTWRVSLAFGAEFGPDQDDVQRWDKMIGEFIDNEPSKDPAPPTK